MVCLSGGWWVGSEITETVDQLVINQAGEESLFNHRVDRVTKERLQEATRLAAARIGRVAVFQGKAREGLRVDVFWGCHQ